MVCLSLVNQGAGVMCLFNSWQEFVWVNLALDHEYQFNYITHKSGNVMKEIKAEKSLSLLLFVYIQLESEVYIHLSQLHFNSVFLTFNS